jgi:hypothetical protein
MNSLIDILAGIPVNAVQRERLALFQERLAWLDAKVQELTLQLADARAEAALFKAAFEKCQHDAQPLREALAAARLPKGGAASVRMLPYRDFSGL